jgi:hypothetical protein
VWYPRREFGSRALWSKVSMKRVVAWSSSTLLGDPRKERMDSGARRRPRFFQATFVGQQSDPCDDVVLQREVEAQGPFNAETERARLARDPLRKEDWQSIEKKNTWVKSGVVDRMVSHFNMMGNKTVLATNVALEHALFPNPGEVTDMKAFSNEMIRRKSEPCGSSAGRKSWNTS